VTSLLAPRDDRLGPTQVDDDLARWLSAGWGGEVILFEGAEAVAVSRRDLMVSGVLPQLPDPSVFPSFRVGREEAGRDVDRDRIPGRILAEAAHYGLEVRHGVRAAKAAVQISFVGIGVPADLSAARISA